MCHCRSLRYRSHHSFLDVNFHIDERNELSYSTYRKPMCLYTYLPYMSAAPFSVKTCIIDGEICRLRRTNKTDIDFFRELNFFRSKLRDRGFPPELFNERIALFYRKLHSEPTARKVASAPICFKIRYSPCLEHFRLGGIVRSHAWLLTEKQRQILDDSKLVRCFLASPSMFRLRYDRFLAAT